MLPQGKTTPGLRSWGIFAEIKNSPFGHSLYGGSYWARTSDLTNVNRTL